MDLIRTYCETAFARVADRWLRIKNDYSRPLPEKPKFILDADTFIDEARIHHPEISDDSLRLIYQLGIDDWSRFELDDKSPDDGNIMRALAFMTTKLLDEDEGEPIVKFRHLFRWRELTQLLGEDMLTCAFLAYKDKDDTSRHRSFDWPSVAHNDNPDLNFLFSTKQLCELHSHLNASANVFELNWVCLMNHISGQDKRFSTLKQKLEPSRLYLDIDIYAFVKTAARLRLDLYEYSVKQEKVPPFVFESEDRDTDGIDSYTALERYIHSESFIPDYIVESPDSPMCAYAGERKLLYSTFRRIFTTNDPDLTDALYRYLLTKSLLRKYIVQTNSNVGFSNFKRYQDVKTLFLTMEYMHLPSALPLWEAKNHNFTRVFESRIVPVETKKAFIRQAMTVNRFNIPHDDLDDEYERKVLSNRDWLSIFHFLKRPDTRRNAHMRDLSVRKSNKKLGTALSKVGKLMEAEKAERGMDAASSEFACRPEAYSQAFRFLRHFGFDATYHAGEDFYDLADGLRAIDEAINLLCMRSGDRLGHALALGINAVEYYQTRHYIAALPKQWMLDNTVWLLMKSNILGIEIDSRTEWFLGNTYKQLASEIGYHVETNNDTWVIPDICDYWESMALRGDDPEKYKPDGTVKDTYSPSPETWEHYALLDNEHTRKIRNNNRTARQLYSEYHGDTSIKEKGKSVKVFELPYGYTQLITGLQEAMMKDISKRQLCIECCPSSNVRIGRLNRFESHPIFRFAPITPSDSRCPLAVTVNTDDLGVFSTSLPNEFSLLALALLKKTDHNGNHLYSKQEVYDWIGRIIDNGHKYTFLRLTDRNDSKPLF